MYFCYFDIEYITLVHNWAITAEVERMHGFYTPALRCPSGRQKFTLVSLLTKHSEVNDGSN